jgi:hypothetical protein
MPITAIRVYAACDECGVPFSVAIDEADMPAPGWSMYDIAVDAVRSSLDYRHESVGEKGKRPDFGASLSSVENNKLLCCDCTVVEDRKHDDDI